LFFFEFNKVNFVEENKCRFISESIALMGTASFCGGVRHKRYSGQRDLAPKKNKFHEKHL
jgi:hypothetical protein